LILQHFPDISVELTIIKTRGDKILDTPLAKIGGKGLFVKEIEEALLDGRVDLAVHSMKDMPAEIPPGLTIGAIPLRENPRDVLVSKRWNSHAELPKGARIGTGSLRRASQLKHLRLDVEIVGLRGNLDTRLNKLQTEGLDAVILAAAGMIRMGFGSRITEYLDETVMLPAVGQGALCIEIRKNDPAISAIAEKLDDPDTHTIVSGERSFLHRLEGGCQVPIAAHGRLDSEEYHLDGLVADVEGKTIIRETISGPAPEAPILGVRLAERLLNRGADKIIEMYYE
jgi:hydroxymethylbilane synthase